LRKFYLNFQVPKFPVSNKLFATGAHELYSFGSGLSRARFTRKGGAGRGMYIFPAGMNAGVWLSHPYSMSFFCHGELRGAVAAAFSAIAMDQLTN